MGRTAPGTKLALQDFFLVNRKTKQFARESQVKYERKITNELVSNPKLFHSYLRRKKVGCPSVGPLKLDDGSLSDDPLVMADKFALAFAEVFDVSIVNHSPAPHQTSICHMPPINLQLQDVITILRSLDDNTSAGGDGIHPCLLKSCALQMAYPLYYICLLSLKESSLPVEWTHSNVVPIFKKGSRLCPLNYRPVSVTSVPCKILERHIVKSVTDFLESNMILSEHQYGFRAGRSTMDQLLLVYNDISQWLDEGSMVDLILFDFSKAFDLVSHQILLDKLDLLGFDKSLIAWIEIFLTRRTMSVSIKGKVSSSLKKSSPTLALF